MKKTIAALILALTFLTAFGIDVFCPDEAYAASYRKKKKVRKAVKRRKIRRHTGRTRRRTSQVTIREFNVC